MCTRANRVHPQGNLFAEYRVESRVDDTVVLEAPTEMLLECLKHGTHASSTIIKLSKRHGSPSLSFGIAVRACPQPAPFLTAARPAPMAPEGPPGPALSTPPRYPSQRDDGITLGHDVPVLVIRRSEAESLERPEMPHLSVLLQVPKEVPFKPVVDRFRSLSKQIQVQLQPQGGMSLSAQNEVVAVKSFFTHLGVLPLTEADGTARGSESTRTRVDARMLSRVLMACSGNKSTVLVVGASAASVFFVHMRLPRGAGGVTMLMPVVHEPGDDELDATPETRAEGLPAADGEAGAHASASFSSSSPSAAAPAATHRHQKRSRD